MKQRRRARADIPQRAREGGGITARTAMCITTAIHPRTGQLGDYRQLVAASELEQGHALNTEQRGRKVLRPWLLHTLGLDLEIVNTLPLLGRWRRDLLEE